MSWKKLVKVGLRCRGKSAQDIGQIVLGVETPPSATQDEGVEDGTAPARFGMADEQPALASDDRIANGIFHQIIVDFKATISEVTAECIVLAEEIADGLSESRFGQEFGL